MTVAGPPNPAASPEPETRWAVIAAATGAWLGVAAALLLAAAVLEVGLGLLGSAPLLYFGRVRAAYLVLATHGAAGLPLGAALVSMGPHGQAGRLRAKRWGLLLLGAGPVAAALAILAGGMAAGGDGGGAPPWYALAVIGAGWLAVGTVLWSRQGGPGEGLTVGVAYALVAATCAAAFVALAAASAYSPTLPSSALLGHAASRGFFALGLGTAGMALAAALLPLDLRRPLYGRRAVWWGLALWVPTQAVAAVADARPDLLPDYVGRLVAAAAALSLLPAFVLGVALTGALVGGPEVLPRRPATRFVLAGALALLAGVSVEAMRVAFGGDAIAFTSWNPMACLLPAMGAAWLMGTGAAYAAYPAERVRWVVQPRLHLWIALLAVFLLWVPSWPAGIAQTALGPSAELVSWLGRLALPGCAALLLANVAWAVNMTVAALGPGRVGLEWAPVVPRHGPSRELAVGATATVLAAAFFLTLFLPSASPAVRAPAPLAALRTLQPGSLAEFGRAIYVRDGCAACHTQRVRSFEAGPDMGPALGPADHGQGSGQAGEARLGPDLAWVGERYPTREGVRQALAAHRDSGALAVPWLWPDSKATADGSAVIDYLESLSRGAPR